MADNPFENLLSQATPRASLWDLRALDETSHRMGAGRRLSQSGGNSIFSSLLGGQDYSAYTYDPELNAQAREAGITPLEASQVRQNVLFPNSGFFGRHNRLSAALESGLFGLMAAHGGSNVGESIQGAVQGLIGGQQLRQGLQQRQFARPFEAANMMEGFADRRQRRDLQAAQIKHYENESEIQAERAEIARIKAEMTSPHVTPVEGGAYVSWPGRVGTAGGAPAGPSGLVGSVPEGPRLEFLAGPGRSSHAQDLEMGTREHLKMMGVDPGAATPAQITQANASAQRQAIARGVALAGGTAGARLPYQNYDEARREHYKRVGALNAKILKSDDPQHQNVAREQYFADWMNKAQEAREKGDDAPAFKLPTKQDLDQYINQSNSQLQMQIEAERAAFVNQWPQSLEEPRSKTPKKAPAAPAKKGNLRYNPATGQLE